jgi:LmbE family N-acetylglucosaminyl deacetylase
MSARTAHDVLAEARALPLAPLDTIVPDTALILAPHADDESLGCGGLIASLCRAGRPPLVVVATDGTGSHPSSPTWPADRLRQKREAETIAAVAGLGLGPERVRFLRLRDTAAPHDGPALDAAVEALGALARDARCSTLLTTWRHDPHCDHLACWRIAEQLAARGGMRLLAFPVWGWLLPPDAVLEDTPTVQGFRLDVAAHRDIKRSAIAAHESQYGDLITDDPDGFKLPPALLSVFDAPFETFLLP